MGAYLPCRGFPRKVFLARIRPFAPWHGRRSVVHAPRAGDRLPGLPAGQDRRSGGPLDLGPQGGGELTDAGALLPHGVAVTDGHGLVFQALEVDRDAERRADLVLSPVELPDGAGIIVDRPQPGPLQ